MTAPTQARVSDPYVGPVSFRRGDPLYGRDREREDLLDLLIAERIVLLYSPSGAGKSSLIESALVPALRDADFEVLPTIRVTHALPPEPGMPVPRNRYVLGTLLSLEEGVAQDRQRPVAELATMTLREYLNAHADRDGQPGNEVLIFDQFEEVLTADPTDEQAKHAFFRELGEVLRDRGHWALFSMREDFLAALDPYLRYVPTRLSVTFRLDLLSVPQALEAIRRPARRVGVEFAEDAARRLVDDLRTVRVQRPTGVSEVLGSYVEPVQLQVACHLLWTMLPPGATEITLSDVEALGHVDQALAGYYAERVATAAARTGVPEEVIRDWFENELVTPQGLRSQVLQGPEPSMEAGHRLLGELLDAHLVRAETRRQATWYELAHDRLIEPVRRDNAAWRVQNLSTLEKAALLWEQEGKPDRLLLLGAELSAAMQDERVRAGRLTRRQREFLDASMRADAQARRDAETAVTLRRSARRLRITVALTTLLALAAVILLGDSVITRIRAEEQEAITQIFMSVQKRLAKDQPFALALAAEGAEEYESAVSNDEVRGVLEEAATSPVSLGLQGQQGPTESAAIAGDANVVVAAGAEDIQTWDRVTGQQREQIALEDGEVPYSVDITDDGSTVAAGMLNGTLLAWDGTNAEPSRWEEGSGFVVQVALSPDGQRLASVGEGTRVTVWGVDGTEELALQDPESTAVYSVDFSPDGSVIATVSDNPEVVLWDAATGEERGRLPLDEAAWSVAFGTDGESLATITNSAVTIWDLNTGLERYPPLLAAPGTARNVDSSLSRGLSVDSLGEVVVYDLATGIAVGSSSVPGARTWGAAFDIDPTRVLVVGYNMDPSFWSLRPAGASDYVTAATRAGSDVVAAWSNGTLAWSSDESGSGGSPGAEVHTSYRFWELAADAAGRRLVALTADGQVPVWDAQTGEELFALQPESDPWQHVALSPDGELVVTADSGGRVRTWDAATGAELVEVANLEGRSITGLQVSPDNSAVLITLAWPEFGYGLREPLALTAPLSGTGLTTELKAGGTTQMDVDAGTFDSDGATVILGTSDGRIARQDASSGKVLWDVKVADEGQTEGRFRQITPGERNDDVLTVVAEDRVVILDSTNGTRLRSVSSASLPLAAASTADGGQVILVTQDDGALAIPMEAQRLLDLVASKVIYDLPADQCVAYRLDPDC
jgi:WD40 repeat protein